MNELLLELKKVSKYFGALKAVDNVSFKINKGQIVSLIGPNGAGKSTLINLITGYYPLSSGTVIFDNMDVTKLPEFKLCRLGMARTFQKIKLFNNISILDNVLISEYPKSKVNFIMQMLHSPAAVEEERESIKNAIKFLCFVGIEKYWDQKANELSYGDQRRLEIARALATNPKLLLLDEPAAGMNPQEKKEMVTLIRNLQKKDYTVLLIEHDMNLIMGVSDYIVVIDHGVKIAEGDPESIRTNQAVIDAYLGRGDLNDAPAC